MPKPKLPVDSMLLYDHLQRRRNSVGMESMMEEEDEDEFEDSIMEDDTMIAGPSRASSALEVTVVQRSASVFDEAEEEDEGVIEELEVVTEAYEESTWELSDPMKATIAYTVALGLACVLYHLFF